MAVTAVMLTLLLFIGPLYLVAVTDSITPEAYHATLFDCPAVWLGWSPAVIPVSARSLMFLAVVGTILICGFRCFRWRGVPPFLLGFALAGIALDWLYPMTGRLDEEVVESTVVVIFLLSSVLLIQAISSPLPWRRGTSGCRTSSGPKRRSAWQFPAAE